MRSVNGFLILGCMIFLIGITLNDYEGSRQDVDFGFYVFAIGLMISGLMMIGIFSVIKFFPKPKDRI
jgi:predicted permease